MMNYNSNLLAIVVVVALVLCHSGAGVAVIEGGNANGEDNSELVSNSIQENNLFYNYDVGGLTLLEKIKLVQVLQQNLPHSAEDILTNVWLARPRSNPLIEIEQAIEGQLNAAPPQYAKIHRKFFSFVLNGEKLLEETWTVPELKQLPTVPETGLKKWLSDLMWWREKNTIDPEANTKQNNKLLDEHEQEMADRLAYERTLNLASMYKVGGCVADKLLHIFVQTPRGAKLAEEYAQRKRAFVHGYEEIVVNHLRDARAKAVHKKLLCPEESVVDKVDALLFHIIDKNQWANGNDSEFVDKLAKLLDNKIDNKPESGTGKKGVQNVPIISEEEKQQCSLANLESEMDKGNFAQTTALLEVLARIRYHGDRVNKNTNNHNIAADQLQLRKAAGMKTTSLAKELELWRKAMRNGTGPLYDKRYAALQRILSGESSGRKQPLTLAELGDLHIWKQVLPFAPEKEASKTNEQNLISGGIVPVLVDSHMDIKEEKEQQSKEEKSEEGAAAKNEEEVLLLSPVELARSALNKYVDFMETAALFGLAKCVSEHLAVSIGRSSAAQKYNQLAAKYAAIQQNVIDKFAEYAQHNGNALLPRNRELLAEDVHTVGALICLPMLGNEKGKLVNIY